MTKEEKQTLYENVCNDITCGTFILLPQYVDKLIAKYTKVYRRKLRRIKRISFKKENTRLKLKLEALDGQTPWKDIKDKSELIKDNAKLKRIIDNDVDKKIYVQLARKAQLADVQKEQLTKAKEKISNLLEIIVRPYQFNAPQKIQMVKEAKQFLNSEVEK